MNTIEVTNYSEVPDNYTGKIIYKNGTQRWYEDGKRHRLDGPAVILNDGTEFQYFNDIKIEDDLKAFCYENN